MEDNPPHVLITGGTGFIGSALTARLQASGARVSVLTRDARRARRHFAGRVTAYESPGELREADASRRGLHRGGRAASV